MNAQKVWRAPSNRLRMILCAVLVGVCFAIGMPALFANQNVVWGICCLVSLPASYGVRLYRARADRDAR